MKDRIFEGEKNLDLLDEKLREVKMASKELDDLMQTLRSRLQRSLLIDKKYALYRNRYILRTGEIPPSDLLENPYIDVEYVKKEENEEASQGEKDEENQEEEANHNEEVNEEVSGEVNEEVNEKVSGEVNEEVNEEVSEEVSEEVNEGVNEKVSEEANEEVNEEVIEEVNENVNEEVNEEINENVNVEVNTEGDIEMHNDEVEDSNSPISEEEAQESTPSEPPSPIDETELNEIDESPMTGTPFPEPPVIEEDPIPEEYEEEYDEGENPDAFEDYDEENENYHESYEDYDYENEDYSHYDDEDDLYNPNHFDESEEMKIINDDQLRFSVQIAELPSLNDVNSIDVFVFIHSSPFSCRKKSSTLSTIPKSRSETPTPSHSAIISTRSSITTPTPSPFPLISRISTYFPLRIPFSRRSTWRS